MNHLNRLASPPVSAFPGLFPALYSVTPAPLPPVGLQWIAVSERFRQFHGNLSLTPRQSLDGMTKRNRVVNCLNRHYYGSTSDTDHSFLVGSWGKQTAMRPPRDVDLYFILPVSVYTRFQGYIWNRQSALLQEVKDVLTETNPDTDMRGDGQVVVARFESYNVEVLPTFLLQNGRYWICDTNQGGFYKETDPWSEVNYINSVDRATNSNLRPLQDRFRQSWRVTALGQFEDFKKEFDELMARKDAARASSLTAPERFFLKTRKKIEAGHYHFAVDHKNERKGTENRQ